MCLGKYQRNLPLLEVIIDHSVGKAFAANPDSFQNAIASELMHD